MTYHLISLLWKLTSFLPMGMLHIISDFIYYLLYYVIRYRRKVVRKNLVNSFPEKTEKEIEKIEKNFYSTFCDYIVENIKLIGMSAKKIQNHMHFKGVEEVERVMNEKDKSCILYIGHLFNWEFITSIPLAFKSSDIQFGQIYRPLANKDMDRLFIELREQYKSKSISMRNALRHITQLTKDNKRFLIGFLADQVPYWEAVGHWLTFFHQDTPVFTGTEKIARRTGCCVFYLSMHREKRGHYVATFHKMTEDASKTKEHELTNMYYHLLENNIKEQPELWLWTHRRWKRTKAKYQEWCARKESIKNNRKQ